MDMGGGGATIGAPLIPRGAIQLAPSWDEKAAPLWAAFSLPQTIEAVKRRHGKRPQFVDHQTEG
jgi:hypothetical protein